MSGEFESTVRTDGASPDVDEWMARGADETVRWDGRPRTMRAFPGVLLGAVLAVGGPLLGLGVVEAGLGPGVVVGALLVPFGLLLAGWSYLSVVRTRYAVTDYALYRRTGVFSRTVRRVSLRRVQNSAFRQGVFGSAFGYGTIDVEAAGGGGIQFADVERPEAVRRLIERERGDADERLPGTPAQWEAVREEIRALRRAFESRPG